MPDMRKISTCKVPLVLGYNNSAGDKTCHRNLRASIRLSPLLLARCVNGDKVMMGLSFGQRVFAERERVFNLMNFKAFFGYEWPRRNKICHQEGQKGLIFNGLASDLAATDVVIREGPEIILSEIRKLHN